MTGLNAAVEAVLGHSIADMRLLQVEVSNSILQHKMESLYARWYNLDGHSDVVCSVIADIHHQGRASILLVRHSMMGYWVSLVRLQISLTVVILARLSLTIKIKLLG
ncbi:MAG: hypothetical protein ABJ327_05155 [Litoreibacter sp.]